MLNSPSTRRLIVLQLASLGFYFFYWCSVSRREINQVLGKAVVPTTWLLALPAGNYWWMWQYSEALETVTRRRLKRSDSFLLYILCSAWAWFLFSGSYNYNFHASHGTASGLHLSHHAILLIAVIIFVVVYLAILAGNTAYICIMQRKIDTARGLRAS